MSLKHLHESFLEKARQPMTFGRLPILAKEKDVPIIPASKWVKQDNSLKKTYSFMSSELRNNFLQEIFDHEIEVGHHATLVIKKDDVMITLQTEDIGQITELDKEFAKWTDELYKDVVYGVSINDGNV